MRIYEWFKFWEWNVERFLFILQRITGWGLTIYIVLHVVTVHQIIYGERAWNVVLSLDSILLGRIILILVVIALIFHGLNGIRIMLVELGYLIDKPKEQDYPYKIWLQNKKHRAYILIMMILEILLSIYAGVIIF